MNKRTQELYSSLVGSSIDFSFKRKLDGSASIDDNIKAEKRRISRNVTMAFEIGGNLCVTLLGEMLSHYMKEIYYMAVRGTIELRRYRPLVLEYLQKSTEERAEHLAELLEAKDKPHTDCREAKVEALRYFLSTYAGRTRDFKRLLTKEEYMIVA